MFSIEFTFEDGMVGGLDFQTQDQVNYWLPLLTNPEMLKKHKIATFVITMKKGKKKLAEAA